jgi:hypothetical protein
VVGLEFRYGAPSVDPARLAPHLAQFKHLEFVKLPHATPQEAAQWRKRLPPRYAVLHCPSQRP